DHRVAPHLKREVLAGGEHLGGNVDGVALGLYRLDRGARGDTAHDRDRNRAPAVVLGGGADTAEVALDDIRGEAAAADASRDRLGQLDHLDSAGAIGQAAYEAALFERRDQAMDA